jgi:holliday junction DNA helicase RuvA
MIRKITGTLIDIQNGSVVIDVNGLGYHIYVAKIPPHHSLGSIFALHTHLAVRENALDLYGFSSIDDLGVFELLLTLPKIGPKSALQILAQADIELLKRAVSNNDAGYLSKMSGMGKKTAEKIVSGLAEKLDSYGLSVPSNENPHEQARPYVSDAIDALVALGYPQSDARKAVQQLPVTVTTATEAVREALKVLSG